jgi:hypothetical protein
VSPAAASDLPGREKQNIPQHPESGCCLSAALYSSLLSLFIENQFYSGNVLKRPEMPVAAITSKKKN